MTVLLYEHGMTAIHKKVPVRHYRNEEYSKPETRLEMLHTIAYPCTTTE
jgi:hypothetical protein